MRAAASINVELTAQVNPQDHPDELVEALLQATIGWLGGNVGLRAQEVVVVSQGRRAAYILSPCASSLVVVDDEA